jgi:hypothetical protein
MRTLVDEPSSFCSFFCTGRGALSPMETSIALPCFIFSRFAQRSLTTASMYGGVPGSRGHHLGVRADVHLRGAGVVAHPDVPLGVLDLASERGCDRHLTAGDPFPDREGLRRRRGRVAPEGARVDAA